MTTNLPSITPPFTLPFFYAALSNCIVHYLVDPAVVAPFLTGTVLAPVLFDRLASVSFNFQLYVRTFSASAGDTPPAQWPSSGASITQELELNIVATPASRLQEVGQVSFAEFLLGQEQTKLAGNHRVFVPCDSDMAIKAGKELFGEPKFKTSFQVNLPSFNPAALAGPGAWQSKWGFGVNDPAEPSQSIFTCIADLTGLQPVPGDISPISEYGMHDGRPIVCRWNILQPLQTWFLDPAAPSRVQLVIGASPHAMTAAVRTLIGDTSPVAVQAILSPPIASQGRAVWVT